MTSTPDETAKTSSVPQTDFEKISRTVSSYFQVDESTIEMGIPTFYLKWPQETKQAFLKLLKDLDETNLMALLRKVDGRVVLRVLPKPSVKPSNTRVNWALFLVTIGTTFLTGYLLSGEFVDRGLMSSPFIGAAAFTVAIMAVLGTHEMGHKLTANRNKIDATPPYFIPGPPPIGGLLGFGTFGAVIMQKSLPPNKDSLFDIGSSGPVVGFIVAFVATVIGLLISPVYPMTPAINGTLPSPLIFDLLLMYMVRLPANYYVLLHPVAFAGWVGMIVTMLNILPAAMLDGGHISRSLFGERARWVLTFLSLALLVLSGFWPMAFLVLLMSSFRHPGPLDDVSGLSRGRKLWAVGIVVIFVLCSFVGLWISQLLGLFGI